MLGHNLSLAVPDGRASTLTQCANPIVIRIIIHQTNLLFVSALLGKAFLFIFLFHLRKELGLVLGFTTFALDHFRSWLIELTAYVDDFGQRRA